MQNLQVHQPMDKSLGGYQPRRDPKLQINLVGLKRMLGEIHPVLDDGEMSSTVNDIQQATSTRRAPVVAASESIPCSAQRVQNESPSADGLPLKLECGRIHSGDGSAEQVSGENTGNPSLSKVVVTSMLYDAGHPHGIGDYVGHVQFGLPEGQGSMDWPSGKQYRGDWNQGKRDGEGWQIWTDGRTFEGQWKNGKPHGLGKWTSPRGESYDGQLDRGKKNGKGTFRYRDGKSYSGDWLDGVRHGEGTRHYPDGSVYVGSWAKDKRHGQGEYTWGDGRVWTGQWSGGNPTTREDDFKDCLTGEHGHTNYEGSTMPEATVMAPGQSKTSRRSSTAHAGPPPNIEPLTYYNTSCDLQKQSAQQHQHQHFYEDGSTQEQGRHYTESSTEQQNQQYRRNKSTDRVACEGLPPTAPEPRTKKVLRKPLEVLPSVEAADRPCTVAVLPGENEGAVERIRTASTIPATAAGSEWGSGDGTVGDKNGIAVVNTRQPLQPSPLQQQPQQQQTQQQQPQQKAKGLFGGAAEKIGGLWGPSRGRGLVAKRKGSGDNLSEPLSGKSDDLSREGSEDSSNLTIIDIKNSQRKASSKANISSSKLEKSSLRPSRDDGVAGDNSSGDLSQSRTAPTSPSTAPPPDGETASVRSTMAAGTPDGCSGLIQPQQYKRHWQQEQQQRCEASGRCQPSPAARTVIEGEGERGVHESARDVSRGRQQREDGRGSHGVGGTPFTGANTGSSSSYVNTDSSTAAALFEGSSTGGDWHRGSRTRRDGRTSVTERKKLVEQAGAAAAKNQFHEESFVATAPPTERAPPAPPTTYAPAPPDGGGGRRGNSRVSRRCNGDHFQGEVELSPRSHSSSAYSSTMRSHVLYRGQSTVEVSNDRRGREVEPSSRSRSRSTHSSTTRRGHMLCRGQLPAEMNNSSNDRGHSSKSSSSKHSSFSSRGPAKVCHHNLDNDNDKSVEDDNGFDCRPGVNSGHGEGGRAYSHRKENRPAGRGSREKSWNERNESSLSYREKGRSSSSFNPLDQRTVRVNGNDNENVEFESNIFSLLQQEEYSFDRFSRSNDFDRSSRYTDDRSSRPSDHCSRSSYGFSPNVHDSDYSHHDNESFLRSHDEYSVRSNERHSQSSGRSSSQTMTKHHRIKSDGGEVGRSSAQRRERHFYLAATAEALNEKRERAVPSLQLPLFRPKEEGRGEEVPSKSSAPCNNVPELGNGQGERRRPSREDRSASGGGRSRRSKSEGRSSNRVVGEVEREGRDNGRADISRRDRGSAPSGGKDVQISYNTGAPYGAGRYAGQIKHGEPHGQGSIVWASGKRYSGAWKRGKRSGLGTFTSEDGRVQQCEWLNNKANGQGKFWYLDGTSFTGGWVDGLKHGHGVRTYAGGVKYDGEWRYGLRHGKALWSGPNGSYKGDYAGDKKNGQGTYTWPDGRKHAGTWKDGKQHGQGVLYGSDGKVVLQGRWKRGEKTFFF